MTPPSGYYYPVPETGKEIVAGDHDSLVFAVRRHYSINGLTCPADISERLEHFLCLHNDPEFCKGEYEPDDVQMLQLTPSQVKDATRLILARVAMGVDKFLVSPMESERRAAICAECNDNVKGFCTTCNGLKEYIATRISDRSTSIDHKLGVCIHCSCILKAKVHVSVEALRPITAPEDLAKCPANCWQHDITTSKIGDKSHVR